MMLSRSWRATLLALMLALLAGCGTTSDEFAGKAAEKLYADAMDDMASGAYDHAIKQLERVEGLAAGTLLAQQSQLDLAYLYWKTSERAQALTTIERFIKLNPSSPGLDYALFLRGVINFNDDLGFFGKIAGQDMSERDQRASRDAYEAFKQLTLQFPNSKYTPDAKARMRYIVDSLAAYEVHVAAYYLRRGAYLAAANRAQQAITEYQQSPSVEEALYILMEAYDKLKLPVLRDDAARVLRTNYPDSAYIAHGLDAYQKPWWKLW